MQTSICGDSVCVCERERENKDDNERWCWESMMRKEFIGSQSQCPEENQPVASQKPFQDPLLESKRGKEESNNHTQFMLQVP